MKDGLRECPFCGGVDLEVCNTHTASYWVECHDCEAQAHGASFRYTEKQHDDFHSKPLPRPYVKARESAIAAWNRRTADARVERREKIVEAAVERQALQIIAINGTPDKQEDARKKLGGAGYRLDMAINKYRASLSPEKAKSEGEV